MKRASFLLIPLLLVAAACGDDDETTTSAAAPPPAADGLVLQVERSGGFVMADVAFSTVPSVSIYGDGRVLAPGATIMIFPGPVLVPLHETTIPEADVSELLELADELGLVGEPLDFGQPPVADAPDTVVTIRTAEGTTEQRAQALQEVDPSDPSLTEEQRDARRRLQELVEAAERVAFSGEEQGTYEPEAYAARAVEEEPPTDPSSPDPQPRLVPWPVELLPPAEIGSCTVFESDAARQLEELFSEADQLTWFTDAEDRTWRVAVRPLLPHETGCDDL